MLAVEVGGTQVRFLVNGTEVSTPPRSAVDTDGITGLRVTHFLNVHIDNLRNNVRQRNLSVREAFAV